MKNPIIYAIVLLCFMSAFLPSTEIPAPKWPHRVLITNDNGIEDIKIIELARAFSETAETYVVASLADRSGTGSYMTLGSRKPWVEVEKRDLGPGITAYGLDGFPADCVIFALLGLLRDKPADLVVSGINGGPNLGHEWFGSGTIGAARTAALGGIPAIAVSGLDQSIPGAVKAACRWVVALSQSPVVRQLQPGQYLTVSIPRVSPDEIKGIRVLPRAAIDVSYLPRLVPETGKQETGKRQRWIMEPPSGQPVPIHDIKGYQERWIVIVPMKVDEVDYSFMKELQTKVDPFPPWPKKG